MIYSIRWFPLVAAILLAGACRKSEAPEAETGTVSKADMQKVFADAPSEVRQVAEQAAADAESQNTTEAFTRLQSLSEVPDLTPDQRRAIARSRNAMLKQLQTGADNGDQQAQQVLQRYQSSR